MGVTSLKSGKQPASGTVPTFAIPIAKATQGKRPARGSWQGSSLGLPALELGELIRNIEKGIPFGALTHLAESTGLTIDQLSDLIQIPARTLARRRQAGMFDSVESERLVRVATVFERAFGLFDGDRKQAVEWLLQPKKALNGETPLAYCRTSLGAREVENLIGRLEHGVFS
jgi:putative toxin-antitoxin system antitoxin component (TIGR02293 family)